MDANRIFFNSKFARITSFLLYYYRIKRELGPEILFPSNYYARIVGCEGGLYCLRNLHGCNFMKFFSNLLTEDVSLVKVRLGKEISKVHHFKKSMSLTLDRDGQYSALDLDCYYSWVIYIYINHVYFPLISFPCVNFPVFLHYRNCCFIRVWIQQT